MTATDWEERNDLISRQLFDIDPNPGEHNCCALVPDHDGVCVWQCSGCGGKGQCVFCGGSGGLDDVQQYAECGGSGRCVEGCDDGWEVEVG